MKTDRRSDHGEKTDRKKPADGQDVGSFHYSLSLAIYRRIATGGRVSRSTI
jgi:hypothetical protein